MKQLFCIGNYSPSGIFSLNFNHGTLEPLTIFGSFPNCSYIINYNNFLYHTVETDSGTLHSYYEKDTSFSYLNHYSSGGKYPCHLALDPTRNTIYVANYGDGSFSAFMINSNR